MDVMSSDEIHHVVRRAKVATLALARGGMAYALPVFFGYDGSTFYLQARHGMKDDYLDATEEACLLITVIEGPDDWASVQAFGRLHRVVREDHLLTAADALLGVPPPPRMGVDGDGNPLRSMRGARFYALRPTRSFGRRSGRVPDVVPPPLGTAGSPF